LRTHSEDLNPVEETEGILQLLAPKLVVSEVLPLLPDENTIERNSDLRNNAFSSSSQNNSRFRLYLMD